MNQVLRIAAEEWRLWRRSRLALASGVIVLALLSLTALVTIEHIQSERAHRQTMQLAAEETFRAQPDRHPHRMVHYGHYVFRTPPPLAILDPGLLPVTGGQLFLEGHRQNTPMIEAAEAEAGLGGLPPWTPALCYQLFCAAAADPAGLRRGGSRAGDRDTCHLARAGGHGYAADLRQNACATDRQRCCAAAGSLNGPVFR